MIVKDLVKIEEIECITPNVDLTKPIKGMYVSDLLSWVMGHAKEENTVLLTVLNSLNVVAVAVLLDFSAVIFCEDVTPNEEIVVKANSENIPLFKTSLSSADTLKLIWEYESIL
ncbi:MAG: AraC family transcriptional regulator [Bacilli bacterium]|nr:AraC family transcriptional regulator [Bacilli bacterium]